MKSKLPNVLNTREILVLKPNSSQELHDCKSQMADLTNKWYQAIRISPDEVEEEDDEDEDVVSIAASDRSTNILVDGGRSTRSGGSKQGNATTASVGGPSRTKS